jgi:hypothetical protein
VANAEARSIDPVKKKRATRRRPFPKMDQNGIGIPTD